MKLVFIILLFFLLDLYFYFGTKGIVSKWFNKFNVFNFFYWVVSILVYFSIIYVVVTYERKTPSIRFNDSIIYSSIIFIILISKFLGILPIIIDDIIRFTKYLFRLFNSNKDTIDLSRLDFLKKSAIIVSGTIFLTLFYGMVFGRYNIKKYYQDIFIDNWPNSKSNYKIIHISDLHLGSFNNIEKLEEVVSMINDENPDLLVFTGDLVNNYYFEVLPYVETLKKLKAKDGKYSVLGNHDYCDYVGWSRDSDEWKDNFKKLLEVEKKSGFKLLLNESKKILIGSNFFNLIGVENWGSGRFNKDGDLDKSMNNVDDNFPTILLSHDPSHWENEVLKSKYKIDLQLSGHTHGMQFGIEIPGFKWSPIKYRYRQWAGLYKNNGRQIYVNRGIGHLGYAGRVGILPDISILNKKSKL